jgi:hypothetical protein
VIFGLTGNGYFCAAPFSTFQEIRCFPAFCACCNYATIFPPNRNPCHNFQAFTGKAPNSFAERGGPRLLLATP